MSVSFNSLPVGIDALNRDLGLSGTDDAKKTGQFGAVKTETQESSEIQGDSVTISAEGRALAAKKSTETEEAGAGGIAVDGSEKSKASSPEDKVNEMIEKIKKKIEKVKEEIKKLEAQDLPDEVKQKQLSAKRNELMQYQTELAKALEEKQKLNSGGGGSSYSAQNIKAGA